MTPWHTPELVFIGTALAVGGACLGWLKARYRNTHHHLLIFCLVGSVGYLAPMHMERATASAHELTKLTWLGLARVFNNDIERDGRGLDQWDAHDLEILMAQTGNRIRQPRGTLKGLTLVYEREGTLHQISTNKQNRLRDLAHDEAYRGNLRTTWRGRETWHIIQKPEGAAAVFGIMPLRDAAGTYIAAVVYEFDAVLWNQAGTMAQWKIAAEFTGLLITFVCMGLVLVARAEQRRQKAVEEATKPLLEELENLDGLVNSLHGVVWEREGGARDLSYISERAAGFLGYSLEKWSEEGFLDSIISLSDRQKVLSARKDAEKKAGRYEIEYRVTHSDGHEAYISEHGKVERLPLDGVVVRGILVDITRRREVEQTKNQMHKLMLEASRQAGMAEVATGVLHNVGNVLNSLNVAAKLLSERLQKSRFDKLCQATEILQTHLPDDPEFFVKDTRGQALPGYLVTLSQFLRDEQGRLSETTADMIHRIEHIRDMIMLQQMHSAVRPLLESLDLATVVDEAVRLEMSAYGTHHDIRIDRQFVDIPPVYLPRSLLLQILVNLVANACQAMANVPPKDRLLTLRVIPLAEDKARICVEDNGCGIDSRHLTKIFKQGYTTKTDGHGFGLHHASLLAADMGGELRAESDGVGKGARFMLDLPATRDPGKLPLKDSPINSSQSSKTL